MIELIILGAAKVILASLLVSAVVVTLLTFARIVEWLRSRQHLVQKDKNNIAFGLKQALENGEVGYVTGIFDMQTNHIVDQQTVKAKDLDKELKYHHREHDVVVYTS